MRQTCFELRIRSFAQRVGFKLLAFFEKQFVHLGPEGAVTSDVHLVEHQHSSHVKDGWLLDFVREMRTTISIFWSGFFRKRWRETENLIERLLGGLGWSGDYGQEVAKAQEKNQSQTSASHACWVEELRNEYVISRGYRLAFYSDPGTPPPRCEVDIWSHKVRLVWLTIRKVGCTGWKLKSQPIHKERRVNLRSRLV